MYPPICRFRAVDIRGVLAILTVPPNSERGRRRAKTVGFPLSMTTDTQPTGTAAATTTAHGHAADTSPGVHRRTVGFHPGETPISAAKSGVQSACTPGNTPAIAVNAGQRDRTTQRITHPRRRTADGSGHSRNSPGEPAHPQCSLLRACHTDKSIHYIDDTMASLPTKPHGRLCSSTRPRPRRTAPRDRRVPDTRITRVPLTSSGRSSTLSDRQSSSAGVDRWRMRPCSGRSERIPL